MKPLFFILMSIISFNCLAQLDDNTKAKLYFIEAEKYFNQNDYGQAVEYIEKAEQELGSPNARTLNLKIKAYYNDGKFKNAETALNSFINKYQNYATEEIKNETLSYFVRIEKAVEEQKKEEFRIAEEQRRKRNKPILMKEIIDSYGKNHEKYKEHGYIYKKMYFTRSVYPSGRIDLSDLVMRLEGKKTGNQYQYEFKWKYLDSFYKEKKDGEYLITLKLIQTGGNTSFIRLQTLKDGDSKWESEWRKRKYWSFYFYTEKSRDDFYDAIMYFLNNTDKI